MRGTRRFIVVTVLAVALFAWGGQGLTGTHSGAGERAPTVSDRQITSEPPALDRSAAKGGASVTNEPPNVAGEMAAHAIAATRAAGLKQNGNHHYFGEIPGLSG